ncbi:phosphotransferase [Microbispora sp. H11081]|uniref:phosphotransferase family protein n=1 Tax=Microbispora sp. H11081 TaxID=2729107 RepID=UPI001B8AC9DD|nr:phosphotransferase [Microbispora sp. H11081]
MDELISRLIARHLPGYEVGRVRRLGEGQDNAAYEVNGELVVRQSKTDEAAGRAEAVRREAALLAAVAELSPVPVPRPVFVDEEAGVLAYRVLPGRPLNLHPVREPMRLAAPLGGFLSRLHAAPVERMETLVPHDVYPASELLEEAEGHYRDVAAHLPPDARRLVEDFLGAEAPEEPGVPAFCHNDLGAEHVLADADTSTVTGVIDWTDAAITDPAYDLALVYRDLGPAVFERTLAHYEGRLDDAGHARVLFYARCALLEDIAYGLSSGERSYADAGLAHLDRTFS